MPLLLWTPPRVSLSVSVQSLLRGPSRLCSCLRGLDPGVQTIISDPTPRPHSVSLTPRPSSTQVSQSPTVQDPVPEVPVPLLEPKMRLLIPGYLPKFRNVLNSILNWEGGRTTVYSRLRSLQITQLTAQGIFYTGVELRVLETSTGINLFPLIQFLELYSSRT